MDYLCALIKNKRKQTHLTLITRLFSGIVPLAEAKTVCAGSEKFYKMCGSTEVKYSATERVFVFSLQSSNISKQISRTDPNLAINNAAHARFNNSVCLHW